MTETLLKKKLMRGDWVIDDLRSAFASSLRKQLNIENIEIPTHILTAIRYKLLTNHNLQAFVNKPPYELLIKAIKPDCKLLDTNTLNLDWYQDDLHCLTKYNPQVGQLFKHTIEKIILVNRNTFKAASSPLLFGVIIITEDYAKLSQMERIESMVHELAHQELFTLNLVDRLILPEADNKMAYAPFQGVDRPPIGRLHAAHSLFRICQFFNLPADHALRLDLAKTILTFSGENELTDFASMLVSGIYAKI